MLQDARLDLREELRGIDRPRGRLYRPVRLQKVVGHPLDANSLDPLIESTDTDAERLGDLLANPVVIGDRLAGERLDERALIWRGRCARFASASFDFLLNAASQSSAAAPRRFSFSPRIRSASGGKFSVIARILP